MVKNGELGGEFVKGVWTIFLMLTIIFLAACINQKNDNEEVIQEEEGAIDIQPEQSIEEQQPTVPENSGPPEQPLQIIDLIDPNTKEIIATISPIELGYDSDYSAYIKAIEELAKDLARGTNGSKGFDQRMLLDKVGEDGELLEGEPMVILKESELVERILAASPNGGDIELPLYITETGYDRTEFEVLDEVVLASYTTYFDSSVVGRTHNINQSSEAISHVIVGAGDYFSFNTTVGPRTIETGYQEALEIINGDFVMGIGGGICQTSSTLFNAVDQLGVSYVERHHHSKEIGYVPRGRDATVSYGTLDFRFQNTTGIPFMIISTTEGDSITVEIRTSQEHANQIQ